MSKYLNLLETIEIHIDIKSFESTLQPILMCILEIWYMVPLKDCSVFGNFVITLINQPVSTPLLVFTLIDMLSYYKPNIK
jgi:hypothetical protein